MTTLETIGCIAGCLYAGVIIGAHLVLILGLKVNWVPHRHGICKCYGAKD